MAVVTVMRVSRAADCTLACAPGAGGAGGGCIDALADEGVDRTKLPVAPPVVAPPLAEQEAPPSSLASGWLNSPEARTPVVP